MRLHCICTFKVCKKKWNTHTYTHNNRYHSVHLYQKMISLGQRKWPCPDCRGWHWAWCLGEPNVSCSLKRPHFRLSSLEGFYLKGFHCINTRHACANDSIRIAWLSPTPCLPWPSWPCVCIATRRCIVQSHHDRTSHTRYVQMVNSAS